MNVIPVTWILIKGSETFRAPGISCLQFIRGTYQSFNGINEERETDSHSFVSFSNHNPASTTVVFDAISPVLCEQEFSHPFWKNNNNNQEFNLRLFVGQAFVIALRQKMSRVHWEGLKLNGLKYQNNSCAFFWEVKDMVAVWNYNVRWLILRSRVGVLSECFLCCTAEHDLPPSLLLPSNMEKIAGVFWFRIAIQFIHPVPSSIQSFLQNLKDICTTLPLPIFPWGSPSLAKGGPQSGSSKPTSIWGGFLH